MSNIENNSHLKSMYLAIESRLKKDGFFVFAPDDLKIQDDENLLKRIPYETVFYQQQKPVDEIQRRGNRSYLPIFRM